MDIRGYKGKIGAIIVTLALISSVFIGYAVNVEKTTTTAIDYGYVTDVSGLFSYDKTPTYVDFDIRENYTGYAEYIGSSVSTTDSYSNTLSSSSYRSPLALGEQDVIQVMVATTDHNYTISNKVFIDNEVVGEPILTNKQIGGVTVQAIVINVTSTSLTVDYTPSGSSTASTFTVPLTSPYVAYGDDVSSASALQGTEIKRITNLKEPIYFTASSTIYFVDNPSSFRTMTVRTANDIINDSTIPKTDLGHGVYSVQNTDSNTYFSYVFTNESTVTSESYSYYDMSNLSPTGAGAGISYTSTTQPNNYVLSSQSGVSTGTLNLKTATGNITTLGAGTYIYAGQSSSVSSGSTTYTNEYISVDRYITIANLISILNLPTSTTSVTIELPASLYSYDSRAYVGIASTTALATPDGSNDPAGLINTLYGGMSGISLNDGTNTITYDCGTQTFKVGTNQNMLSPSSYALFYNTNNSVTWYRTYSHTAEGIPFGSGSGTYAIDNTISYAYSHSVPTYMDVNYGVKVNVANDHTVSRWSNTYSNGLVKLTLHADSSTTAYTNTLKLSTGDTIVISHQSNTFTTVSLNGADAVNVGQWHTYEMIINATEGTLQVIPVDVYYNAVNVHTIDYTYNIGNLIGNNAVTYIDYYYTASSWRISVLNTQVFLDTYNAVMKNPSINISSYFTDMTHQRLNLYSFALYGESVTINGTTYYGGANNASIRSTGNIVIGETAYTMQDLYLTWSNDHTYITFVNDDITIDLGATTDSTLSFVGYWYFTTALYEGNEYEEKHYDLQWGTFAISIPALALLMAGLIVLGVILVRRFTKAEMTFVDYALITGAIVIALVMAGGIMK